MTDQTMDAETVEKLRELCGQLLHSVDSGEHTKRVAGKILIAISPPEPEPAAKLLAESPTEAKAARELLTALRNGTLKPAVGERIKASPAMRSIIDAFFAEYGNSTQDENP